MNIAKLFRPLVVLLVLAATFGAQAQSAQITVGLPASPPLVQVQPGVQVVEGSPDEVFFNGAGTGAVAEVPGTERVRRRISLRWWNPTTYPEP